MADNYTNKINYSNLESFYQALGDKSTYLQSSGISNSAYQTGAGANPITWCWDGFCSVHDVNKSSRGQKAMQLTYPGAGTCWGFYYMPIVTDIMSGVNTGMDMEQLASFNAAHYNLVPRLTWAEIFLKGLTGYYTIHSYYKYFDENENKDKFRYASKLVEKEKVVESGTEICGGPMFVCQTLKSISVDDGPRISDLDKKAFGTKDYHQELMTSWIPDDSTPDDLNVRMEEIVSNGGKRIDDIINEEDLYNHYGFAYCLNNGTVLLRSKIAGDGKAEEQIEDDDLLQGFVRLGGPDNKVLIHDSSKEEPTTKYGVDENSEVVDVDYDDPESDYDLIELLPKLNQITIKAKKKIYLRAFDGGDDGNAIHLLTDDANIEIKTGNGCVNIYAVTGEINIQATEDINITSDEGDINIMAPKGDINIRAKNINEVADEEIDIEAQEVVIINGAEVWINSASHTKCSSSMPQAAEALKSNVVKANDDLGDITEFFQSIISVKSLSLNEFESKSDPFNDLCQKTSDFVNGMNDGNAASLSGAASIRMCQLSGMGDLSSVFSSIQSLMQGNLESIISLASQLGIVSPEFQNLINIFMSIISSTGDFSSIFNTISGFTQSSEFDADIANLIDVNSNAQFDNYVAYNVLINSYNV